MPFDFSIPARGSVDASKMTPRERLEFLRDFLRTPTPNVAWDYRGVAVAPECGTAGCALGWWQYLVGPEEDFDLEMPGNGFKVFIHANRSRGITREEVTPSMVADDIDAWLRGELDV